MTPEIQQQINDVLRRLDKSDRRFLESVLAISRQMRSFCLEYNYMPQQFANMMGVEHSGAIDMLDGTHDYQLKELSVFEVLCAEAEVEKLKQQRKLVTLNK